MSYRPTIMTAACPNCYRYPLVKRRWFQGYRAECACGVCGPFVRDPDHVNAVIGKWNKMVMRHLEMPPPPPGRR